MTVALQLAVSSAVALVMVGALLGVSIARLCWAEDLQHARRIDAIRSRTEASLNGIIDSQRGTIDALNGRIEIMERAR